MRRPLLLAALVTLAACSNSPPRLEPVDDVTGKVDAVLEFELYGADVDDDDLSFRMALDGAPSELISPVSNNQAHFRWIPGPADVGEHTADFFLTDGIEEVSERITITVTEREGGGGDGPVFVSQDRFLLDVTAAPSIEFTIEVKEDSTTDVTLELTRTIEGARFHGDPAEVGAVAYGKKANFFWAPSDAQKQVSQHFLSVRAYDGSGNEASQDIAIVLRGVDGSCTTEPPRIDHAPLGDGPAGNGFFLDADITDAESEILEATAFFSLVPGPSESDFKSVRLTGSGNTWSGLIPDPALDPGAIATVTYYLCARDDDDPTTVGDPEAGDRCDRLTCTDHYQFLASGPLGGFCAPCASDAACPAGSACVDEGGGRACVPDGDSCAGGAGGACDPCQTHGDCGGIDDYCLVNGETGESFCGVDCSGAGGCDPGFTCADLGGIEQCVPESFTCQAATGAGLCEPCQLRADCGGPRDYCLQTADGVLFCGQDCSGGGGCPAGYTCHDLTAIEPGLMQCGPSSGSCGAGPGARAPRAGDLVVNELLADPPAGADVNGDGTASTVGDEFVELLNATGDELDLSGVTLDDAAADSGVRFTFPAGATLGPGRAVLVFGGGDAARFPAFGGSRSFVAPQGLGLNNAGDTVTLRDVGANLLAQVTYGAEGGQNQSLTLSPDGAGLAFQLHGTVAAAPYSPGSQLCGNSFPISGDPCGGGGGCSGDRDAEPNDDLASAVCLSALPAELEGHLDHAPGSDPAGPDGSDFFSFEVSAGQTISAATYPGTAPEVGDTVLRLYDPGGAMVLEHDDNDPALDDYYSALSYSAGTSGSFVVEVAAYRSSSTATVGSYILRVEAP